MTNDELIGRCAAYELLLIQALSLSLAANGADDVETRAKAAGILSMNLANALELSNLTPLQLAAADDAGARVLGPIAALLPPLGDAAGH